MGAIINLSHFIADKGKEKAKFTEIMNTVDSSSPVSDHISTGRAHGFSLSNKEHFWKVRIEKHVLLCAPLWYVISSILWILYVQIEASAQTHL